MNDNSRIVSSTVEVYSKRKEGVYKKPEKFIQKEKKACTKSLRDIESTPDREQDKQCTIYNIVSVTG